MADRVRAAKKATKTLKHKTAGQKAVATKNLLLRSLGLDLGNKLRSHLWIDVQEFMLGRLDRVHLWSKAQTPRHLLTGLRGERAALFELRRRGMIVVARRWTNPKLRGDVDVIGWDGDILCFVEVKTRTARDMTPAEVAVDDTKRDVLRSLARAYLHTFPEGERESIPVRFDVVAVYAIEGRTDFQIFQGAFSWR